MTMLLASWECLLGENEWCTADSPCFECATVLHAQAHPDGDVDGCRECKLATLRLSPVVGQETRGSTIRRWGWKEGNSWERGLKLDERGQPFLKPDGSFVTVKDWANNRSGYEKALRDARTPIDSTTHSK